jgi:hypothetical protein
MSLKKKASYLTVTQSVDFVRALGALEAEKKGVQAVVGVERATFEGF